MMMMEGKRVLMIAPFDRSGGVSTHTKSLIKELEREGAMVNRINTMTRLGWRPDRSDPLTLIDNAYKLFKWMFVLPFQVAKVRKETDLVHIQTSGPLGGFIPGILGSIYTRFFKLPTVITFHYSKTDAFVDNHPGPIGKVVGRSDAFIVVSERQASKVKGILPHEDRHKVHAIPNGFDPDRFEMIDRSIAKKKLGIPIERTVLVNVAWVMEKKGHIYLIEAVRSLIEEESADISCFVIGQGPLLERMRAEVGRRGLDDRMRFLGYLPHEEMVLYMNAADLFVISSLNEGNPVVMFEALGLGKPIVSTDVGGIPEVIGSDDLGILVGAADSRSLAKAILRGIGKRWDEERLIEYSKLFTWSRITDQTIEVYRQVLHP